MGQGGQRGEDLESQFEGSRAQKRSGTISEILDPEIRFCDLEIRVCFPSDLKRGVWPQTFQFFASHPEIQMSSARAPEAPEF